MIEREQLEYDSSPAEDVKLGAVFDEALRAIVKKEPKPPVEARFYPYAGLSSTIRLRRGRVYVRVSDILRASPREVLYALACILIAKLYRLKSSKEHERTYREYTLHLSVLDASETARRRRGYKKTTSPRGKVYDLDEMFSRLNARYFDDRLERPLLSWSQTRARRVLGHHDHVHGAIIISRVLDSPRIPRFVIEYVLYHEMLHVKHPPRVASARTIYHSQQFRLDERRFEQFEEALKWLEKLALPVRRRPRKARLRSS
ncbi:MAG TPA: M48 family peptidase [Blastocatellia bacterium]|jgi:predicted metal-dependent hydrolase|nr:M48 family peptidase [Blastocatellia bacterium]